MSGFPRLAGLDARYLAKQLADYAAGLRQSEVMSSIARRLSESDMDAVSKYYASLPAAAAAPSALDTSLLQQGAFLYASGSRNGEIQGCINCHGPRASGTGGGYPALAGQPKHYLMQQLNQWREGARRNDVGSVMKHIAKRLTETEIDAVAEYLSRLRPEGD